MVDGKQQQFTRRANRLGEMEKAVNGENDRPLTASVMLRSWTPGPINAENRRKTCQVKFSPIVVRDNKNLAHTVGGALSIEKIF